MEASRRPDPTQHLHDRGTDHALRDLAGLPSIPPSVHRERNERLEQIATCRSDAAHWKAMRDSLPDHDKFKHRRAALKACIEGSMLMASSMEAEPENAPGYLEGFAKRRAGMAALDDTDLCPWCGVALTEIDEPFDSDASPGSRLRGLECKNKDCPHDWYDLREVGQAELRAEKADRANDVAEENARAARAGGGA